MNCPQRAVLELNVPDKDVFALNELKHTRTYTVFGLVVNALGHGRAYSAFLQKVLHAVLMLFHVHPYTAVTAFCDHAALFIIGLI